MWTPATRRRHSREHLRYASDVSDEEWALLEPHLPAPCLTGRPRAWPMREIVNAIFYVLRSGSQEPRPDRLRRPAPTLGRRALLRLDRPQPPPRQGLRGNARIRPSLPLRRLHHAAHPTARAIRMSFESDS